MSYQSHPLEFVIPNDDYTLICYFKNGEVKKFDFEMVFKKLPVFEKLKKNNLFFNARVDYGGLCVVFNDDLDISEETLYQHGAKYDVKAENKKVMKEIYKSLKDIRKEQNMTQKQLSCLTKIPQSGLARIESGNSDVSLSTLSSYLEPLGYTIKIVKK